MENPNPRDDDSTDEEEEEGDLINPNMKPYDRSQTIQFSGIEETNSYELNSRDITIIPSSGEHETGSSKIKMKNVVDFNWEFKYYPGQLLAIHVSGKYLAYGIKTVGKTGGVVRVVSRESGNRTLLKKMVGMVQDIGFAHIANQVILASVDETGTLCVHRVEEKTYNTISCSVLLQVEQGPQPSGGCHRIFWCPYTPDEDDPSKRAPFDVDAGKLLCLTHGNRARLVNVGIINERFGADPVKPSELEGEPGYLEIASHTQPVIDASFAPDGSAIATASQDGYVKFFQVDVYHKSPIRCLHEWKPHGDKPLSALVFVDNHKTFEPHPDVQFWKFLITGAENNSELKFWSCESWTCLQTIRFTSPPPRHGLTTTSNKVTLKVGLDLGADYLLVSDIHNKLLYVMELYKYPAPYQKVAYVRSITEFLLPYPMLSFAILDAGVRNFKSPSLEDLSNEEAEDDLGQYIQALVVRMYLVQPKSLQECTLAFQPPLLDDSREEQSDQLDTLTHDSMMFVDGLSDLSGLVHNRTMDDSLSGLEPLVKHEPLTLLGPNAFTSPGKESPTAVLSPQMHSVETVMSHMLDASAVSRVDALSGGGDAGADLPLATSDHRFQQQSPQQQRAEGFASGGSSPSREVQEIFSLNNSEHNDYYEEKELADVEAAAAKLHLMPTPPTDNALFEVNPQANGVLPTGTESAGWPPIPLELVNEARNSAGDSINAKRRSIGGEKSLNKVYLAPISRTVTQEKLRDLVTFDGVTPTSIVINKDVTLGSKSTWALLEYENPRDAEAAIGQLHNKSPHHWVVKYAARNIDSPMVARNNNDTAAIVTPPQTPEQRPSVSSRLDGLAAGDTVTNGGLMSDKFELIAESLNEKILSLVQIVEQQNTTIKGLTNELSSLRRSAAERDRSQNKALLTQVDKMLAKSRGETAAQWQEYLAASKEGELERKKQDEAFLHANAQMAIAQTIGRLPGIVQEELRSTVLPQLSKAILQFVEPMQAKLHQDLGHQLASIDHQLKSHISQLVQGKTVTDILSQSAAVAMKPASQACFTEVYTQSIMPRFEKACNLMFKQVNDTFAKGTQEFIQTFDGHMKKQQQQHDKAQQLVSQLQSASESMRVGNEHLRLQLSASVGQEVASQVQKGLGGLQDNLAKCVRDNVREHLTKCFQRQQAAIETKVLEAVRCITPAPHIVDSQTQILQLIANEDINGAFQMALSAADLGLVVLVCEKVDPETLFSQFPCPLQQNVLLSLIQQLSADMLNHTETKHKYLLEAVMNLDTRNPETRGHIPAVIQRLQQQLKEYMVTSSNPKMVNKVKQLLFSTKALLNVNNT